MEKTFANEFGNTIRICVEAAPALGGTPQVRIVMEGPTSTAENIITQREAEVLLALLSEQAAGAKR